MFSNLDAGACGSIVRGIAHPLCMHTAPTPSQPNPITSAETTIPETSPADSQQVEKRTRRLSWQAFASSGLATKLLRKHYDRLLAVAVGWFKFIVGQSYSKQTVSAARPTNPWVTSSACLRPGGWYHSSIHWPTTWPTMRPAAALRLLPAAWVLTFHSHQARAYTFNVVADPASASSSDSEVYGLEEAMELAEPGDVVQLADGIYTDQLHSSVSGEEGDPITVSGGRGAVLMGSSPSVYIEHSWISLKVSWIDSSPKQQYNSTRHKQYNGGALVPTIPATHLIYPSSFQYRNIVDGEPPPAAWIEVGCWPSIASGLRSRLIILSSTWSSHYIERQCWRVFVNHPILYWHKSKAVTICSEINIDRYLATGQYIAVLSSAWYTRPFLLCRILYHITVNLLKYSVFSYFIAKRISHY